MFFLFLNFSQTLTTVSYSVAIQPCRLREVIQHHRFFFSGGHDPIAQVRWTRFLTDVGDLLSECVVSCRVVFVFFNVFPFFPCHALSSRSLGFGIRSPNLPISNLAGLIGKFLRNRDVGRFCSGRAA